VFGELGKCRDRVKFTRELGQEVSRAHNLLRESLGTGVIVERMVTWRPPQDGWLKLNTDRAFHKNPVLITAGGVIRDAAGSWCGGFALNIGVCSTPLAELWGVYYGLYIAWERHITRLEVEVDSELVVGFLSKGISDSHPLSFVVHMCHDFLSRD